METLLSLEERLKLQSDTASNLRTGSWIGVPGSPSHEWIRRMFMDERERTFEEKKQTHMGNYSGLADENTRSIGNAVSLRYKLKNERETLQGRLESINWILDNLTPEMEKSIELQTRLRGLGYRV